MYVKELDNNVIDTIEYALRKAIQDTGHYNNNEVEYHVQQGLDSKISDIVDTIDIQRILNE